MPGVVCVAVRGPGGRWPIVRYAPPPRALVLLNTASACHRLPDGRCRSVSVNLPTPPGEACQSAEPTPDRYRTPSG